MRLHILPLLILFIVASAPSHGAEIPPHLTKDAAPFYVDFYDSSFPFYESTLDFREADDPATELSVSPRCLVLPLGNGYFAAFDTELLRVAAIWKGDHPSLDGLAKLSYGKPLVKAKAGTSELPRIRGETLFQGGFFAGWQKTADITRADTRTLTIDPQQSGKGPIELGSFRGTEDRGEHAILHYSIGDAAVREIYQLQPKKDGPIISRWIEATRIDNDIALLLDSHKQSRDASRQPKPFLFQKSDTPQSIRIDYLPNGETKVSSKGAAFPNPQKARARWSQTTQSTVNTGEPAGPYRVDEINIPYPNPWQRRIRPADIAFQKDGVAFLGTYDGDIYRIQSLDTPSAHWTRIAAGFDELQTLLLKDGELYALSKLGITKLVDQDSDGEIDFYQMFCNRFVQSPDTRGFALSMIARNDGTFLISKGGQQHGGSSPHAGRVIEISPDGKTIKAFAQGFRNAVIAYDSASDTVTASDQQGRFVPSTPYILVEEGKYYGHEKSVPDGNANIEEPELWLPHRVAQSGFGQIYGFDKRSGPLAGRGLYLDYQHPRAIRVEIPSAQTPQVSGSPLSIEFQTPLLKGAVNPADGFAYIAGFQIWGCTAKRIEGISRLAVNSAADTSPFSAEPYTEGILLKFDREVDSTEAETGHPFEVEAWNYQRTPKYGSPQFDQTGEPGIDSLRNYTAIVSKDRKSVFLAIPKLYAAMQIGIHSHLFGEKNTIYTTANSLKTVDLDELGFDPVDLNSLLARERAPDSSSDTAATVSKELGQTLYTQMGCIACHSIDGTTEGKSGPTWLGLYGSKLTLADDSQITVGHDYLYEAITKPEVQKRKAFLNSDEGMPSYLGVIQNEGIESLVLYIKSLSDAETTSP